MPFKIPDNKRLNMRNMGSIFSQYADDGGPLESTFAMAVARDRNAQLPSPAEPANPNIPQTEITKMDSSRFALPVGMGSWMNMSPEKWNAWARMKEGSNYNAKRDSELEQIRQLILNNPELAGEDPESWTIDKLRIHLRQLKAQNKQDPFKKQKDLLDIQNKALRNAKAKAQAEEAKNKAAMWGVDSSTSTSAGFNPGLSIKKPDPLGIR